MTDLKSSMAVFRGVSTVKVGGVVSNIGSKVPPNIAKQLQRQINGILGWKLTDQSPMCIPKAFNKSDCGTITERPYFVCEKSEGIRFLALLVQNGCYLISQNYEFQQLPLFCPVRPDRIQPGVDKNAIVVHHWTLLDGEMVADKDGPKTTLTFMVYDILVLNGHPVVSSPLTERLKWIQNDIIAPRKAAALPQGHPAEKFQLALQSMYPVNRVNHIIRNIIPRLGRTNVGLVFIPTGVPYSPGYASQVFQWRAQPFNFVDFQLSAEWRGRPPTPRYKLVLRDNRTAVFYDWLTVTPEELEILSREKKTANKIAQCIYDPDWLTFIPNADKNSWDVGNPNFSHSEKGVGWRRGGWRLIRIRIDKGFAFEKSQMEPMERSITEGVKLEEFEELFPDDPVKAAQQAKILKESAKHEALKRQNEQEKMLVAKRKRNPTQRGLGVCYDFQNKGLCRRGDKCHFSHCACDTYCKCTTQSNTFGKRPFHRREEGEAGPASSEPKLQGPGEATANPTAAINRSKKKGLEDFEDEKDSIRERQFNRTIFAEIEQPTAKAVGAKLKLLQSARNRSLWNSIASGSVKRDRVKKNMQGFSITDTGSVQYFTR